MGSKGRWTEKDLAALKRNRPSLTASTLDTPSGNNELPKKTSTAQREKLRKAVIDSIKQAKISGSHERGKFVELRFDGARLLTENFIRAANPFKLVAYKKACHQAIEWATILVTGGARNFDKFTWFTISAHIQAERLADTDAKEAQLKHMIDGLTRSGIIEDDSAKFFSKWGTFEHTIGKPFVVLRVEQAEPPNCVRGSTHFGLSRSDT